MNENETVPVTEHIETYPNRTIKESLAYDAEGRVHGPHCRYYPNGVKCSETNYKHGVLSGTANIHREDGRAVISTYYQDGVALYNLENGLDGPTPVYLKSDDMISKELTDPQDPRN